MKNSQPRPSASPPNITVTLFRFAAFIEALSWIGLLYGMAMKYFVTFDGQWARIFGQVHGLLVMFYLVMGFIISNERKWPIRSVVLGTLATIPPFFTIVFDRWAAKTGHYGKAAKTS